MRILRRRTTQRTDSEVDIAESVNTTESTEVNIDDIPESNNTTPSSNNPRNSTSAIRCPSCFQTGHRRQNHHSCPMNPNFRNANSSRNSARDNVAGTFRHLDLNLKLPLSD
ncbi:unnamed protein product [Mucor hiemalis]